MSPSFEPFLRRDRIVIDYSKGDRVWRGIAIVVCLVALVVVVVVTLPKAKAEDLLRYQDVHSLADVCRYARQHPGAITNLSGCV